MILFFFKANSHESIHHKAVCSAVCGYIGEADTGKGVDIDQAARYCFLHLENHMSWDMSFPTMWHFDKCRLRRACAASF